jgi:hypothetical protein
MKVQACICWMLMQQGVQTVMVWRWGNCTWSATVMNIRVFCVGESSAMLAIIEQLYVTSCALILLPSY